LTIQKALESYFPSVIVTFKTRSQGSHTQIHPRVTSNKKMLQIIENPTQAAINNMSFDFFEKNCNFFANNMFLPSLEKESEHKGLGFL
jgi:hypothetical protein